MLLDQRALWVMLGISSLASGQTWQETCGRTEAGAIAIQQALRDVNTDALVLLVASHPDDRYVLPAVWLRYGYGVRISVLLATRGGGGQNLAGPETGDSLERIRTLETEAGCSHFGGEVWYLNRPDAGYRRSAAETFAEWGREPTLRDLVRLLRRIRPDCVITTHHAEEQHGHDLALVDLLPAAVELSADSGHVDGLPPHRVRGLLMGSGGTTSTSAIRVDTDRLEPVRGLSLRQLAYRILRDAHTSPGLPAPIDSVFEPELRLEPRVPIASARSGLPLDLPSVFDADIWPGVPEDAARLRASLSDLPARVSRGDAVIETIAQTIAELEAVASASTPASAPALDARARLSRRIAALQRLMLLLLQVQLQLDVPPGTVAVAGEEFAATVRAHTAEPVPLTLGVAGLGGVDARFESVAVDHGRQTLRDGVLGHVAIRVPLDDEGDPDPMAKRFRADRFEPPVRLRITVAVGGQEVPVDLTVPVEQRAPVELAVVPRMLLVPTQRKEVQFSVTVARHTQFPVVGSLEVRAPAGYVIAQDHREVALADERADQFGFAVAVPTERKAGVDVLRIRLGSVKMALPVHKVDVRTPERLRVALLSSRDDTLPGILGVGGLGVAWSDLSDADIAVADLRAFDTIVVDIRALQERPGARRGFRRLLDFATGKGRRLVVFYQKDTEFHPKGEGFVGAPFQPFQVGRARVTRADAPVRVLRPEHPLLTHPNTILPGDWDGWEQERALYLPYNYAAAYEEVLAVQDPGQPEERGALLYARTGDGEYVYCALALWRQLKKLHPGAVRLLANLLTPSPRA